MLARIAVPVLLAATLAGCVRRSPPPAPAPTPVRLATLPVLSAAAPAAVGMDPSLGATLDSIVRTALARGAAPGAALVVGRHGRVVHTGTYGRTHSGPDAPAVSDSTLWDLASLTKVVATTTAAMLLEEEGLLDLDRTVASYLPELSDSAKAAITVRMLLTHTGGLEAFAPLYTRYRGREQYLEQINARPLRRPPGSGAEYSDWDFVLLQLVVERLTGLALDHFARDRIFLPLGMRDTHFAPDRALRARIAPTETDASRGGLIHGEVHDPNAWAMGGVAGHAGLFSSARDLAVFAQMLLNGGAYGGVRLLRPEALARWTAPQQRGSSRALGWDTPSGRSSAGRYFGPRSFGHTGFTGTSLWLDPERGLFVLLLTNRVHAGGSANDRHVALRRDVADAAQRAILDAPLVDWESAR